MHVIFTRIARQELEDAVRYYPYNDTYSCLKGIGSSRKKLSHARPEAGLEPPSKAGGRDKYPYPPSWGL